MTSLATQKKSSNPREKIPETKIEGICEALSFPDDLLANAKVRFQIQFLKLSDNFVQDSIGVNFVSDPTLVIDLPYPENVAQAFRYSYEPADLSFFRLAYDQSSSLLSEIEDLTKQGFSLEGLNSLIDAGKTALGESSTYVGQTLMGSANQTVGGLVGRGTGQIPNPNPSLFFQGVPLRTHNFVWQFIPKTEQESRNLHKMIKRFRERITPKRKGNFLTYPDLIQIKIVDDENNDMSEKYGTKFLKSHVSSFNINYTPAGTSAFYKDGYPAGISLAIDVQEIEMYADEVADTEQNSQQQQSVLGVT